jgi:hypothetical protein
MDHTPPLTLSYHNLGLQVEIQCPRPHKLFPQTQGPQPLYTLVRWASPLPGARGKQHRELGLYAPASHWVYRSAELWSDGWVVLRFSVLYVIYNWTVVSSPYSFSCKMIPNDAEDQIEAGFGAAQAMQLIHGHHFVVRTSSASVFISSEIS